MLRTLKLKSPYPTASNVQVGSYFARIDLAISARASSRCTGSVSQSLRGSGNSLHHLLRRRPAPAFRQNPEVFVIFQPLPDFLQSN